MWWQVDLGYTACFDFDSTGEATTTDAAIARTAPLQRVVRGLGRMYRLERLSLAAAHATALSDQLVAELRLYELRWLSVAGQQGVSHTGLLAALSHSKRLEVGAGPRAWCSCPAPE